MDWLKLGFSLAPYVATVALSILGSALAFKRWIAPSINETIEEANKTITNLAKLSGIKSQEYSTSKSLEKNIAKDVIQKAIPELEALKLVLSPSTWEKLETSMEENPEAILQLYQKWGPLLGMGGASSKDEYMF